MSDIGIDTLFKNLKGYRVQPKYSRLFCDVERFRNDEDEIMSRVGQGVIYTHTYDGTLFHRNHLEHKNFVLSYYDVYHRGLDAFDARLLKEDKYLLILDLHLFLDEMASAIQTPPFPDICIGVNEEYYDERIMYQIIQQIEKRGYTYRINYPYNGALIPNCIYTKGVSGNVVSIMLGINKRIYSV